MRILVQKLWHGAQDIRYGPSRQRRAGNRPRGQGIAPTSRPSFQRVLTGPRRVLKQDRWLKCLKRPGAIMCLQLLREKAGQSMRNVEKKSVEMASKVEEGRKALATAEQNRDANEKALAEARSHFQKTQQEHFARFPSGYPLDNGVCAWQVQVVGLYGFRDKISLFLEDWELAKVASSCHTPLDMLRQEMQEAYREACCHGMSALLSPWMGRHS